jgi:hypothetical protein
MMVWSHNALPQLHFTKLAKQFLKKPYASFLLSRLYKYCNSFFFVVLSWSLHFDIQCEWVWEQMMVENGCWTFGTTFTILSVI